VTAGAEPAPAPPLSVTRAAEGPVRQGSRWRISSSATEAGREELTLHRQPARHREPPSMQCAAPSRGGPAASGWSQCAPAITARFSASAVAGPYSVDEPS
jgi:hypothetical protein